MRNPIDIQERGEEFDAVVTYLNAVSAGLPTAERRDVAGTLHELVLRRKGAAAGSLAAGSLASGGAAQAAARRGAWA